jgi:hypothetical protein
MKKVVGALLAEILDEKLLFQYYCNMRKKK